MPRRKTQEEFIADCIEVHGDTYDYSEAVYKRSKTKVKIICKEHGPFYQTPGAHLRGHGCSKCGRIGNGGRNRKTQERYIEEVKEVWKNRFDLSKIVYKNNKEKIKVGCPKHGFFKIQASSFLKGHGCRKCSVDDTRTPYKEFVERANKAHNNKFKYFKQGFKGTSHEVKIKCPIHGIFSQNGLNHLTGLGCIKCSFEALPSRWSYEGWEKKAKKSNNFDSYKVYIIKIKDPNGLSFYKIGRTYTKIKHRFKDNLSMPYNYQIIHVEVKEDYREICELEKFLQNECKEYKYTPKKEFGGMHECYSSIDPIIPLLE